ncbi:hypothetical protein EXS71_04540 [Candidatus Uhrbacteria bacterium]|nr:hypothetical protein [Candidatus Uhrbacteria bacterium]
MKNIPIKISVATAGLFFMISFPVLADGLEQRIHIVKAGENLWNISKKIYGTPWCWPVIAAEPSNNIDYQGPLFIGKKISLPAQSACEAIQNPVRLESAPQTVQDVADVSEQPWYAKYLLIDNYLDGTYRDPVEYESIDRLDEKGQITDSMFEWFHTPTNGSYPMYTFSEVTNRLAYTWGSTRDLRSEIDHLNNPPTPEEKRVEDEWLQRIQPYVPDMYQRVNDIRKVSELMRYRDGSHWGFRFSVSSTSLVRRFVIDGVPTDPYYHADRLTILPNGRWAFRYQQTDPSCEKERYDNCPGGWLIKTSEGEYGPYKNISPPIPTINNDLYFWMWAADKNQYALYKNGELQGTWPFVDYLNYTKNATGLIFRVRDGDQWSVAADGKAGRVWDYVDLIKVNHATGSIFYRARDLQGKWYIVKNEQATLMPFEPQNFFINPPLDEAFAVRYSPSPRIGYDPAGSTEIFSSQGHWHFLNGVDARAIDRRGNILFVARQAVRVPVKTDQGKITDVCSSSICHHDYIYWINDRQIGTASFRMLPLFSKKPARVKRAFYYEGNEKAFYYSGVVIPPAFDAEDRLVLYVIQDTKLKKLIYKF